MTGEHCPGVPCNNMSTVPLSARVITQRITSDAKVIRGFSSPSSYRSRNARSAVSDAPYNRWAGRFGKSCGARPIQLFEGSRPAEKVHSLIDKVYKRKNLEMAWEKAKENRGSGGVGGQTLDAFEA
jgi:hypothetical protein